ncbi:hypothetical protein M011DRAFT_61621 [Sporormia fimetaria CBS 119925]|uniref:DUF4440 domain-containing protein n=1 Tax=Sporormia fimetaria CBS 119925 TaxID=1340428 RepID=A0A6A6VD75_9PLEO|nr:hypothetical protein M011DRAFT_61621 [Sporormia fimetaria CBS 119925]
MEPLTIPTLTTTICHHEHRTWRALCDSGSSLLPLLSTSPVMIFPGNILLTSTSTPSLHSVLTGPDFVPWKSYTLSHDEVVPLGNDGALIYYRVEAMRGDEKFRAICSSGVDGGWRMKSHQQTLI